MVQRRRSIRPFVVAIVLAVGLIVGLRLIVGGLGGGDEPPVAAACGAGGITLTMAASPEKAELVKQLAAAYQRQNPQVDGHCAQVKVTTKSSGAAMAAERTPSLTGDATAPDLCDRRRAGGAGWLVARADAVRRSRGAVARRVPSTRLAS